MNGVCNDWSRNNHNIVVLQGWLFGISIVGMVLVGLGMLVGLCRLLQMDREIALVMEMVIGFLLLVKFLVYSIA